MNNNSWNNNTPYQGSYQQPSQQPYPSQNPNVQGNFTNNAGGYSQQSRQGPPITWVVLPQDRYLAKLTSVKQTAYKGKPKFKVNLMPTDVQLGAGQKAIIGTFFYPFAKELIAILEQVYGPNAVAQAKNQGLYGIQQLLEGMKGNYFYVDSSPCAQNRYNNGANVELVAFDPNPQQQDPQSVEINFGQGVQNQGNQGVLPNIAPQYSPMPNHVPSVDEVRNVPEAMAHPANANISPEQAYQQINVQHTSFEDDDLPF